MEKTWNVYLEMTDGNCPFWVDMGRGRGGGCGLGDADCTFEDCPARVQNEPVTAEWLESVGAEHKTRKVLSLHVAHRLHLCGAIGSGRVTVVLLQNGGGTELSHIRTRHQFARLYEDLSGRELVE